MTAIEDQARSIFLAALERVPDQWPAVLDEGCGDNVELRSRVEQLLRAHQAMGSIHGGGAGEPVLTVDEPPISERPGTVIGPYKLLEQIGEGGFGVVFMAEQTQPVRRKVALKVLKPGMDTRQVIARFEAERQALAMMDHVNIARVLDAGATAAGLPYFVMELVYGVPITRYCDENRLTPRERLGLFIPVCQAIQHAHQKGIIHRDVKPSNVLVTLYDGKPAPKVIDFGVAKATEQRLTERTLFTQYGTIVGTFEYMAPEQAELSALGVDTRSDIYSLGVLLYELLTGTTPLERKRLQETGFSERLRLIKEEEPPRPSLRLSSSGAALATICQKRGTEAAKLTRLVRGELDWIVMKCLEKDRNRRYESANGLARDVERYLADEPVEACPPSAGYRLRKFARRHKKPLAIAVAFAGLLLAGALVSTWQAVRATVAEGKALQAEQTAMTERDEARDANVRLKRSQEDLRRTLYVAHMNMAQHAWETGGVGRVLELLEQYRPGHGEPDPRGFEWHYLYRLCHTDLLTLRGHAGAVTSVAYSPDGKLLASASEDGTVKLWEAATGQFLRTIAEEDQPIHSLAFSPDGRHLAAGIGAPARRLSKPGEPGTIKVWEVASGRLVLTLAGHERPVTGLAFHPSKSRLASGSQDGTIKVWDLRAGRLVHTIPTQAMWVTSVAFSPDGRQIASTGDAIKLWDADGGQTLCTLAGGGLLRCVAFSPDGKFVASAGEDRAVRVWEVSTGKTLHTLRGHAGPVQAVAFSPDGRTLVSGSTDQTVRLWDLSGGEGSEVIKGHEEGVRALAFRPDGKQLASASADRTVKVWDLTPSRQLLPHEGEVWSVGLHPGGTLLAVSTTSRLGQMNFLANAGVTVWDLTSGQKLRSSELPSRLGYSLAVSPDGKRLAVAYTKIDWARPRPFTGEVQIQAFATGELLLALEGHDEIVHGVAFSPDGQLLATAGLDGKIRLWDTTTGKERQVFQVASGGVWSGAFSPDGRWLAGAGGELGKYNTAQLWQLSTGQAVFRSQQGRDTAMQAAFSPEGTHLASALADGRIRIQEVATGNEVRTLKGRTHWVGAVAFSPDGTRLASGGFDGTITLWDPLRGEEILTVPGHTARVHALVFSPDGHRLISGSADGTVRIWDATPLPGKPSP